MENNDFFLDFSICKSQQGKDENGNYTFVVEASNENIDLQNQIVLQRALMESKDEFLKGGVISYDHLHKTRKPDGTIESNPSMIIGEPIDVWTDGKSTFVKGILYSGVEMAKDVINLLKSGSTRIRASVGGIFPKIKKNAQGIEQIVHVLWNDLALTPSPVNNTVGSAVFAKSLSATEFVDMYKSLSAGNGTDHAEFTNGRAMQPENIGITIVDTVPEHAVDWGKSADDKIRLETVIDGLVNAMELGVVGTVQDAVEYLKNQGISSEQSNLIVHEVIELGGKQTMFKGKFGKTVSEMLKSLNAEDEDEFSKSETEDDEDDDSLEEDDDTMGSEEDDELEEDDDDDDLDVKKSKSCKKSVDATILLKSIADDLHSINSRLDTLEEQMMDVGNSNVALAGMVKSITEEEIPMKATMHKSITGKADFSRVPDERPSQDDFVKVQHILNKCVREGKIDMVKSCIYESEFQRQMNTGVKMSAECYSFLAKEMKGE